MMAITIVLRVRTGVAWFTFWLSQNQGKKKQYSVIDSADTLIIKEVSYSQRTRKFKTSV